MNELSQALGLIEVIGYPTAIAAADAALKSADVHLITLTKVGSGIMTVQLTGDVAAVRSAVDTGGEEAKRVGTLRAVHVIPRCDTQLMNGVVTAVQKKAEEVKDDIKKPVKKEIKNGTEG